MARTETTDKASVKNGRSNKGTGLAYNANHNTLEATRLNQAHIDVSRMYLNSYIMFNEQGQREKPIKGGQGGFDAREHEKKLYEHFYGEGLEARNQRCIKDGHRERCQTIEQLYSNPKTAPLETIFQVGSTKSVMDKRTRTNALARAWSATIAEFQKKYGEHFKPADCALHRDEAEDHIHFRVLLGATDKFGHFVPNQNAALEAMGFERPDPAAPRSRYTITVPAQLAPSGSGTVTLSGTWASDRKVTVTANETVTLTNSINANDKHTLDITFAGISKAGDNTQARTYTETVSVAAMPADALFGTWSGTFYYNVEVGAAVEMISFTIDGDEFKAEKVLHGTNG